MTRIVAFDHGTRRIGVAVADTEVGLAYPRPALRPRSSADATAALEVARKEGAERLVVGLPRNMDGSEGRQAAIARRFAEALGSAGYEVEMADERLTSWEAGARLAAEGRRPDRRSGELDSAAARLMLQEYLDARRPMAHAAGDLDRQETS